MSFKFQHLGKTQNQNEKIPNANKLQIGEIIMTGAMVLVIFGPKKFRPGLRHFITLIGILGTIMSLFRRRS